MSTGFKKVRGGGVRLRIDPEETEVVRALVGQLLDLLGDEPADSGTGELPALSLSDNTAISDDPVLARLFPDAYEGDRDAASDFRRYTESGLREGKREAAKVVLDTIGDGGEVVLDAEQAQAWLRALNDVRLALGTRLDITEDAFDTMRALDWDDSRYPAFAAYDWLTYLQESLVHALW